MIGAAIVIGVLLLALALPASAALLQRGSVAPAAARDPSCSVGSEPTLPAYDPVNHDVYVPNFGSGNISVLNGSSCSVVATITLPGGSEPEQAAFDPRFNYIDVTDYFLGQVYEILGTKIVTTFGGFDEPLGIAYDPGCHLKTGPAGCMVVANSGGTTVRTLSGISATVGPGPDQIAYDPFWNTLLVTDPSTGNVSVLSGAGLGLLVNVSVGADPEGVAFDPQDSEDYVADAGSNNVTVLGGPIGPGAIDGTITGFDVPLGVAWDQATLHVYVSNFGSGKLFVVAGLTILSKVSTTSGSEVDGIAYDQGNCKMFVAGTGTDTVYELS